MADLKARLIASRLSRLAELISTSPRLDELDHLHDLSGFVVVIATEHTIEEIRAAAEVDGVASIHVTTADGLTGESGMERPPQPTSAADGFIADGPEGEDRKSRNTEPTQPGNGSQQDKTSRPEAGTAADPAGSKVKVGETMRVDIERLDTLLNLTGELVVNRARFVQVARQLSPALKKVRASHQVRELGESLRRAIDALRAWSGQHAELAIPLEDLQSGLRLVDEQSKLWDQSRLCFSQMTEAIDQLTRVSDNLQRGVLGARMVPVAPLFNRFRRIVRDLSLQRGKQVRLQIRGEQTELDKRMIDELGEPLVHLVRNSIDHGLESPEIRRDHGKPACGTIYLEASYAGNSVYIHIRDDGAGVDVDKIKRRLIDDDVLPSEAVEQLSDDQAMDYIWHPGFSTAREVTDVSGRGVGMDVVKTRIAQLNRAIGITSSRHVGTTFSLRLPLTLAIINSLLVRMEGVVYCIPIDDVCEIVSLADIDVVSVLGNETVEVRGEFLPLVTLTDVFRDPPAISTDRSAAVRVRGLAAPDKIGHAVILQALGRRLALQVDELIGSQDIVIKSLAENFTDIRGLSGASILGDGSVCLMLDTGQVLELATTMARTTVQVGSWPRGGRPLTRDHEGLLNGPQLRLSAVAYFDSEPARHRRRFPVGWNGQR